MTDYKKLRVKIAEAGLTQKEFAERAGITESRASFNCNNDSNLEEKTLKRMAKALGCTIDEIV